MKEKNKNNKGKNKKNDYTKHIFKLANDEEFFKSSSEDLSRSVSLQKEIKQSEENTQKIPKVKNILLTNERLKEKIINSKGSTSSSNKIKTVYPGNEEIKENNNNSNNDKNNNDKNVMYFEEIEYSENNDNENGNKSKENIKIKSNKLNLNNLDNKSSKKVLKSNKLLVLSKEDTNSNKNEEDIQNIVKNYVDSSYNSSKNNNSSKINNSNNIIDDAKQQNISNNNNNKNELHLNSSKESYNKSNDNNKNNNSSYLDSEDNSNDNKKHTIINLKPVNIKERNQNSKDIIKTYKKKISTMYTSSEVQNLKSNQKSFKRKASRKISQREYSVKSSNSSNKNDNKEENTIKIFIEKNILNIPILIIIIVMSVFSLFSNDIRHIWFDKNSDIYFDIINLIALFLFIIEIIILCLLDDKYFISFIFWVDIIGILCIFFNVEIINNYIFYNYKIKNEVQNKKNNSFEYIHICKIMLERVISISKVLECLKLYNLINSINKFKKIYSEKQKRDFVKEEIQKKKLIEKIHNIEADEEIEESILSNESFHQTKNSTLNELNDKIEEDEEKEELKDINRRKSEKKKTLFLNLQQEENKMEIGRRAKRAITTKRLTRITQRKESLRFLRQNFLNSRNTVVGHEKLNILNTIEEGKKKEENKIQKQIEEEIYKKFEENINNIKITNKVKNSMRKKNIAFFIILLLISVILNEELYSQYIDKDNILYYSYILDSLNNYPNENNNNNTCYDKIKNFLLLKKDEYPIINITKNDILIFENINLTDKEYRYCEYDKIHSNNTNIVYSIKKDNKIKHILFLILTLFSCISIIIVTILSETDLTNILLTPLEIMIELANRVAKDPMNAKNIEELEQGVRDILQKNNKENTIFNEDINKNKKYNDCYKSYEIKAIMNAIIKISALLAMSVGEAGGEIIHKNLSAEHGLHLHSRGKKKIAIFGFCNIRNFEEINLALEEETIPLINKIAEIVQSSVDKFRGNTNKNIGDSFLNVWKFYNNLNFKKENNKKYKKDNLLEIDPANPQINITADCAALAYLRCILKINKNLNILEYNNNRKLNTIMQNFKIDMGFGLHLGYGIEGPVGSIFKMEASYLSPNVNIAARLETATKQFGVNLLISGKLYNLFTDDMKEVCRYVDCVTVKGSTEPIDLYTIDINNNVTPQRKEKIRIIQNSEEKLKAFKEKRIMIEGLIEEYGSITPIILEKNSYLDLIDEKSDIFYEAWENAMKAYKKGKWNDAKKYFEECLEEDVNDGPANTLYNYIKKFNFKSPDDWKGERELTNK